MEPAKNRLTSLQKVGDVTRGMMIQMGLVMSWVQGASGENFYNR